MYENSNIEVTIKLNTGEQKTLDFNRDDKGNIRIFLDNESIDVSACIKYISVFNNFARLLTNHILSTS